MAESGTQFIRENGLQQFPEEKVHQRVEVPNSENTIQIFSFLLGC